MTPFSVVLAFRDSSESQGRFRVWNFIYSQYERFLPEAQIVVGTDDGEDPFHKTVALNRAVAGAKHDLLLIADTDTWCPSAQVREAVAGIEKAPNTWWRPWNRKLKLGPADSERLLQTQDGWDGTIPPGADHPGRWESMNTYWAAPPHLFTREQYERVGRFDERFRGWGQEDEAFALSLRSIVGRPQRVFGTAVHLYHPRIGKSGKDLWEGETSPRANEDLVANYRKLVRYPDQMERFVRSR